MLEGNIEVLSDILNFAGCHIIIVIEIVVIVGDIVDDIGCVTGLTVVLSGITVTFLFNIISKLDLLLDTFALWVNSSSLEFIALS